MPSAGSSLSTCLVNSLTDMPIELNDSNAAAGTPVLRHQRIGEMAALAIIRTEQRDRLRRDPASNSMVRIPNGTDRNGQPKYKQELVVHCLALPGTNMEAGIGDMRSVPAPGDRCRVILKAKAFGDFIEARRNHRGGKLNVGDILMICTDHAQAYDQAGAPKGAKITDQATADALPRGTTVGFYGSMELQPGTDPAWIEAAENTYRADQLAEQQRNAISLDDDAPDWDAPASYAAPAPAAVPPVAPLQPASGRPYPPSRFPAPPTSPAR